MKEILKDIRDNHILLEVVDGKLKVFANGPAVDPELIARIKDKKNELILFLTTNDQVDINHPFQTNIPVIPSGSHYPLSFSQRRLWILSQINEANVAYNTPALYVFEGDLNKEALSYSFDKLIERHEVLRTSFKEDESGEVRQFIRSTDEIKFKISFLDLRWEEDPEVKVKSFVQEEMIRPFDLASGPLVRAALYQVKDGKWIFTCVMHHIISDAWSMGVLIRELLSLYNAYDKGEDNPLPFLRIQYKDYAAWQQQQSGGTSFKEHREYWLNHLKGELPVFGLSGDKSRPAFKSYNGGVVSQPINAKVNKDLKNLCHQQGCTLFMGLLATVNTLLYRYTDQDDIIIGSSIAGREHADLEDQIGFYANTLALRSQFSGGNSYKELLENIKQVTLAAYEHQAYPFDELVDELQLHRDMSRGALFDVMVVLQNTDIDYTREWQNLGKLKVSSYLEGEQVVSRFDLAFNFIEVEGRLQTDIVYNSDIFSRSMIERLAGHFERLLASIVESPSLPINQLEFLSVEEKGRLLEAFGRSVVNFPEDRTVVDLFEAQAAATPEAIALVFEDRELTYGELNKKSDRLANYLRTSCGVGRDDLVGILLDRSEGMFIALLGILKSGGAYVAIEPDIPDVRKEFILTDTGIRVLITQTDYIFNLGYYGGVVFAIDIQLDTLDTSAAIPRAEIKPEDLAYVLYTSGSTGQPKGVMISHRSLVDYTYGILERTNIGECRSFGLVSTIAADLGNTVIYPSLCTGGRLQIFSAADVMDPAKMVRYSPDCLKIVPSHWKALQEGEQLFLPSKCLIFGGEQLTADVIEIIRLNKGTCKVYNHYGPSETTIGKLIRPVDMGSSEIKISLGRPFCNTTIYIVDTQCRLLPIGVPGEICIGGEGLARGYWNKPELTVEKFVSDPFRKNGRMYKTGDLGRWLEDGTVEFLGRKDDQVKIRGYRIELGEIGSVLTGYRNIESAVVLARPNKAGEKELVAYMVSQGTVNTLDIRSYLSERLPAYMVPGHYMQLEVLPLTANGKVDRKKLPDPEGLDRGDEVEYIAPRTATEEKLALIWEEVLGRERIGIKDDFFVLGGHSLRATRLASQIHKQFEVKIDFHELFTRTVLEEQAQLIEEAPVTAFRTIRAVPLQPDYPLSSSQRRLWALSRLEESNIAYNVPGVYVLEGDLNVDALTYSFNKLIERHEILRTVFIKNGQGEPRQRVHPVEETVFRIGRLDCRGELEQEERVKGFVQGEMLRLFDMETGPLVRADLYQVADNKWVFTCTMHHIISDGWSKDILIRELLVFYDAHSKGASDPLPALRIQYKDYAVWQQEQLKGEMLQQHRAYWLQQFAGELPVLALPGDKPRPSVKTNNGGRITRLCSPRLSNAARSLGQEQGGTLFMVLVATVNALLHRYTHQQDIIIGSPSAGREHPDLEDQIGFYINTLALRTRFREEDSFRELLRQVRQVTLGAYEHQLYPFDTLVEELALPRDVSRHPLFDVWVVLQNDEPGNTNENRSLGGLKVSAYQDADRLLGRFDLLFSFMEIGEEISAGITYNKDIYERSTIEYLGDHLLQLLEAAVMSPDCPIGQLEFLNEKDKQVLLEGLNQSRVDYPRDRTIVSLFEEQAARTPDNVAVVFERTSITYKELNEQANQLGDYLRRNYQIVPDDLIGIKLERSEKMIVCLLAVLKAGGAYVPVDGDYPPERVDYIVRDSGCKVLLDEAALNRLAGQQAAYARENPLPVVRPEDLAYVIYTSGSTGQPKGVMISHQSLMDYTYGILERTNMRKCRSFGLVSTIAADLGNTVIYPSLLTGGALHIFSSSDVMSPERMTGVQVDCLKIVPSHWNALQKKDELFAPSKCLVFGGEPLGQELIEKIRSGGGICQVYNHYGPTETTVGKLVKAIDWEAGDYRISLGAPIGNTQVYILDDHQKLLPRGVIGEICIGGDGLARGYWNRPELTAERFVPNPFREGTRLYRTGDLGRILPDGSIGFIGRKDDQVKIRGFRIELGEIENTLRQYEGVSAAVVMAREDGPGDKRLVAYITGKETLAGGDLLAYLSKKLPGYMIPGYYIQIAELPLTANGKIDRRSLPLPEGWDQAGRGHRYIAPGNETEEKIAAIWSEVLSIPKERVGVKDSFFEVGGHSLNAIRMMLRIHEQFDIEMDLTAFFAEPTIEALAAEIGNVLWLRQTEGNITITDRQTV